MQSLVGFLALVLLLVATLLVCVRLWLASNRSYQGSTSVAEAYNR